MNIIKITLVLTDAARIAYATQNGEMLASTSEFDVNLLDFTSEQRASLLAITGAVTAFDASRTTKSYTKDTIFRAESVPASPDEWLRVLAESAAAGAAQHAREVEAAVVAVNRYMPELERLEALNDAELIRSHSLSLPSIVYPETQAYHDRLSALITRTRNAKSADEARQRVLRDEQNARDREHAAQRQAAETALAAQRAQERAEWVAANGSDFLKKALGAGYDCQQRYTQERAALEHPEYILDYFDAADWHDRSCPSEAALDEALRVDGEVVWLKDHPTQENFKPCEAVVVRKYLDKYDLVRTYPS